MDASTLLWFCAAICLCSVTFICSSQSRRREVRQRLGLHGRAGSSEVFGGASRKESKADCTESTTQRGEHATTLPPSQRHLLAELGPKLSKTQRQQLGSSKLDQQTLLRNIIGFEEDYRTCDQEKYLPSGLKVREVRVIGDFPDYSFLTGVPHPKPYPDFKIETALPRPYRPFRWPYHQTMSLYKLESDWWIELENTYRERIAQRQRLYAKHGTSVLAYLPGSELACKELMEVVLQNVTHRYPHYFSLPTSASGTTTFHNTILKTTTDLSTTHPLHVLLAHIPEDFVLMLRHPSTGLYHFRAGVICSSLGWNLGTKFDRSLHDIHANVPHYPSRMSFSMNRFFANLPYSKPIQRGSWGFEVDQPLWLAPGDPLEGIKDTPHPDLTAERCHLRVDWQTLRRLPLSGALAFNFKALFTPLEDLRTEKGVPALIVKQLRGADGEIQKYKGTEKWYIQEVVLPTLERWAEEQVENGLVERDWDVGTLEEAPFFEGWEGRWRGRQGF